MKPYWFKLIEHDTPVHDQPIRTKPKSKVFFLLGFMVILGCIGFLFLTPPNLEPVVQTPKISIVDPVVDVPVISNPVIKKPIDDEDEDSYDDD